VQRLHALEKAEVFKRQTLSPARVYATDRIQQVRIQHARDAVKKILLKFKSEYVSTAHTMRTVVELGANSCDISGYVSMGHQCHAWEVSPQCVQYIVRNFPWVELHIEDVEIATPMACDLLILCEILEHLVAPEELVKRWLPQARYAVISSPLRGDLEQDLSGGEHCWSFDETDFQNFVRIGGHEVIEQKAFAMGQYCIKMLVTKRIGVERGRQAQVEQPNE